jgi:hypothetical protein
MLVIPGVDEAALGAVGEQVAGEVIAGTARPVVLAAAVEHPADARLAVQARVVVALG